MTIQFNINKKDSVQGITVTMNNTEGLTFMKLLSCHKAFRNIIHPEDYKILVKMYTNAKEEIKNAYKQGKDL